ncbi:MAG TPA: hypothetical protein VGP70_14730 [Actinomadura sp.]|nr:hypothetical protein [Actinomadura sp.]
MTGSSGLAHLAANDLPAPGDLVMLVGIGAGSAWSCAVIDMGERPEW